MDAAVPESERGERSVRLVAGDVAHGRPPEVIAEDVVPGRRTEHVLVPRDGGDVVVHEVAAQRVGVGRERDGGDGRVSPGAGAGPEGGGAVRRVSVLVRGRGRPVVLRGRRDGAAVAAARGRAHGALHCGNCWAPGPAAAYSDADACAQARRLLDTDTDSLIYPTPARFVVYSRAGGPAEETGRSPPCFFSVYATSYPSCIYVSGYRTEP